MARRFVDMETGEIIDLEHFRAVQVRLIRQSRLVTPRQQAYRRRRAWSRWEQQLVRDLAPLMIVAAVISAILLSR